MRIRIRAWVGRLTVWLLTAALVLTAVPGALAAPADTVYVRKHISMVYDNSGSMSMELSGSDGDVSNLKWAYASYAAQIFAGLLNDTDSLTMTLMNRNSGVDSLQVDLSADRQSQVDQIMDLTNYAKNGTPFNSVIDAEQVLVDKGLLTDEQIGSSQIDKSSQYWLVLTTDGNFNNMDQAATEQALVDLLERYSNLQLVYFGIGTEGDRSEEAAVDLRGSERLKAYPNFTALYAEKQEEIVTTMQTLANRISGRYSVSSGVTFDNEKVTVRISGESSPIRNIALLAQRTDARLLSAVDEDGNSMIINRPANEQFPRNENYDNLPQDTKGAHTALITCPDGKFPPCILTLTFSEPVDQKDFSLMYEPAIYVDLVVEQQDASGSWTPVPYGRKVQSGAGLRVNYQVCEDGTGDVIDPSKLPGVTSEEITCGDREVGRNSTFSAPGENAIITASISLMDGAYVVSTNRTLQVVAMGDYSFDAGSPMEIYADELAVNDDRYVEFRVTYQNAPATADRLSSFSVDAGGLEGKLTTPETGVFRFTPRQEGVEPGTLTVSLNNTELGQTMATQTVTVLQVQIGYSAQALSGLTLFSNETASNTEPVIFSVTRTQGDQNGPLPEEEAGDFRVEAVGEDGAELKGVTAYENGQIRFTPSDNDPRVGRYTITLYRGDEAMAATEVTVLEYNAQFTAQAAVVGDGRVELFHLRQNTNALAFMVYTDGEPCTAVQLESMLDSGVIRIKGGIGGAMKLNVSVGGHDGKAALLVQPTASGTFLPPLCDWLDNMGTAWRFIKNGPMDVELIVQAEKGARVIGTLELYHTGGEQAWWIICSLMLLALAGYITLTAVAHFGRPRIKPGTITCYELILNPSAKTVRETAFSGKKFRIRKKWRLWPSWKPEDISVKGLRFTASRPFFRKSLPICLIDMEQMTHFTYQDNRGSVECVTEQIGGAVGQEFPFSRIAADLTGRTIVEPDEIKEGTRYYPFRINSGCMVICREGTSIIKVWLYRADSNR